MLATETIINQFIKEFRYSEQVAAIRFYNFAINHKSYATLQTLNRKLSELNLGELIVRTSFGDYLQFTEDFDADLHEDKDGSVVIQKSNDPFLCFFSENGFKEYLSEETDIKNAPIIKIGFIKQSFSSKNLQLLPLYRDITPITKEKTLVSAMPFVKPMDTISQEFLTQNVANLVLEQEEQQVPTQWKIPVCKKLLCTLGNEFLFSEDELKIYFKGQGRKKIVIELSDETLINSIHQTINDIANWIYLSGKDIETRHTIFNHQISSLVHPDFSDSTIENKQTVFKEALENSSLAYNYHLKNEGEKLSDTLVQLNKTLFDYTTQIRNNTSALISGLWKDFTTLLGYLFLKFALKEPDLEENYFEYLSYGLIAYLILSLFFSARNGFGFYDNVTENLEKWRYKIYGYLSKKDFEKLVTAQLKKAQDRYITSFSIITIIYVIMIIVLLLIGQ